MALTRGEKWLKFFTEKGWINNDVISGGKADKIVISIRTGGNSGESKFATSESLLYNKELDILCFESSKGTVYFQWDDIISVQHLADKQKKGWL